jgi:hypothetical protein
MLTVMVPGNTSLSDRILASKNFSYHSAETLGFSDLI